MKKILVIETGGTISGNGKNRLDLKDYVPGRFRGEDYIKQIPELHGIAYVHFELFAFIGSSAIRTKHWIDLRNRIIKGLHEEHYDGVVITHGTNTLEETAYFLHLTIPSDKPVVLVGAQRPFSAISSDAHLNLINAVRVAAHNESRNKGVLVVLNDEINSAREVTKTNTYRLEAFQSGQFGYLGYVDIDETIQFYRSPTRKHTIHSEFSNLTITDLPAVEIVYSYAGATGELINHITNSGKYKGIITAGTGAGLVSPDEKKLLYQAIEKGLFIVRSTRVGNGRVVGVDQYKTLNSIQGDNLLPQKARILLMISLLVYNTVDEIQHIFNRY